MNGTAEANFARQFIEAMEGLDCEIARRERDAALVAMVDLKRLSAADGSLSCASISDVLRGRFGHNIAKEYVLRYYMQSVKRIDRRSRTSFGQVILATSKDS